jgi:hypothetical protein
MPRRYSVPSYRLRKQSGQAIVTLTDGLGGRRAVLGHRSPQTPEVYAELDAGRAAEVMEKLGQALLRTVRTGPAGEDTGWPSRLRPD